MHEITMRITCGRCVQMQTKTAHNSCQLPTYSAPALIVCVQNSIPGHRIPAYSPLFFHGFYSLNTSGIRQFVPTFHRAYNKQSEVYIKI